MTSKHEDILTKYWWEHQRFRKVGDQLAAKFKAKPAIQQEMRQMFRNQNDKLSYYDLF